MAITGHRTREMFDRYNIVSEGDLEEAAERAAAYREAKRKPDSGLNSDKNRDSGQKQLKAPDRSGARKSFRIYGAERGT